MKTNLEKLRPWVTTWMYGVAFVHFVVGLLLPWVVSLPIVEAYHVYVEQQFWGGNIPQEVRPLQQWWIALFGPTIAGMSVWMGTLVYFGARYRSRLAWVSLIIGTLIWAPQDIYISLQRDVWLHLYLDCFALASMLPPLIWLWWHDSQYHQRSVPSAKSAA